MAFSKNWKLVISITASLCLAAGIGGVVRLLTTDAATPDIAASPTTEAATSPSQDGVSPAVGTETFDQPFVQATRNPRLANPALLKTTSKETRANQVASGRFDPFAPITHGSTPAPEANAQTEKPADSVASNTTGGTQLPPLPTNLPQAQQPSGLGAPAAGVTLPQLPPVPIAQVPTGIASQPPALPVDIAANPVPLPRMIGAEPRNPIDALEVSGVLQVGSRTSAIIREGGELTSRYVYEGDYVLGGRVLVKRIDLTAQGEPRVVLEQNGREYVKQVGSVSIAGLL